MTNDDAEFTEAAALGVSDDIAQSPFVVLKFGGSSVATIDNWQRIAAIVANRIASGLRPIVVHSALAGVSNLLVQLLAESERGEGEETVEAIVAMHEKLGSAMSVPAADYLEPYYAELRQLAAGLRLVREISPRMHARVLALGELMATTLSTEWLASQGIGVRWVDACELLTSTPQRNRSERQGYLSAVCDYAPSAGLRARVDSVGADALLVPGFIAANGAGETVLLGRGGSDTTAAYLAAMLKARRLEVWSDVPGVFTADPRIVPEARLLTSLHYDEAQEIASTGGSVLHPRSIPPMRNSGIPIFLRCTSRPTVPGTTISPAIDDGEPLVKAISLRQGLTLLSLEGIAMWQEAGFMADAFRVFARYAISVDLVSTSESNVTLSIDAVGGEIDPGLLDTVADELRSLCRVRVLEQCAAVSLVGRRIRAILHKIGPAFGVFEEERVYLLSQAANDLNLSFVVDEDNGYRLVERLHASLISSSRGEAAFGPSWLELEADAPAAVPRTDWWRNAREPLLEALGERDAAYVYRLATVRDAASRLLSLESIDQVFYAMKANANADVLATLEGIGVNFECVSTGELDTVFAQFPDLDPARVLFTPNFASRAEYVDGLARGVNVTLDNLYLLRRWPDVFAGKDVFVRIDTGQGRGHHEHVRTAGVHSKFGIPLFELDELAEHVAAAGTRIVGIHAHSGSGILNPGNWPDVARRLAEVAARFPDARVLDLGGGLGIPDRPGEAALDLDGLDRALGEFHQRYPALKLWLEPGRYLVAEAGVLLARVTQTKGKGNMQYVGVATGMNSLIRPALYGAYHEIVNLSRLNEPATDTVTVVGPICESADKLGSDRLLPRSEEGDVMLVSNAGAYGYVMSSRYNLREPATELTIAS